MKKIVSMIFILVLLCVIVFAFPASAISQNFNLSLPAYCGQVDLISGYKSTNNDWAYVRVDSIGGGFSYLKVKVQTKEIVWYDCSGEVVCYEDGDYNYIGLNYDLDIQDPIRIKAWNPISSPNSVVSTGYANAN